MKTSFFLGFFLLSLSAFASEPKKFASDSLNLVTASMECSEEFSAAVAETNGPNPGLKEATLVEGGHHEFDQTFTLKFGISHPMIGVLKTKQLVVERRFTPTDCPKGAMDCGGGTFRTICRKSDINER